jgi:shikimate dehydrogenase
MRIDEEGRRTGDIVDGVGFVNALAAAGRSVKGRRTLVVGAGGVGTAIAFAIAGGGPDSIAIADLSPARAADLSARIAAYGIASSVAPARGAGYDLIVNASPLGMQAGDPLAIDLAGVTAEAIVGDVVNVAHLTPLLLAAQALGCHVQRGVEMMLHQVAPSAAFLGFHAGDWSAQSVGEILAQECT